MEDFAGRGDPGGGNREDAAVESPDPAASWRYILREEKCVENNGSLARHRISV